jgi:phospholipid/cholesterol/gamma-HCH transport system substrate-binding protein
MAASRRYRILRTAGVSLSAAAAVMLCGSCTLAGRDRQADYCAIMPDAVGLYVGNSVTQMGYPIGKVTAITPSVSHARVDFTVTAPRLLSEDVKAVTRSTSILADRSLELVGNFHSGAQLSVGGCIPLSRSSTPMSLSAVIGSATQFVNSVNPSRSTNVGDVVRGIDLATRNTGARIDQLLTTSSAVLDAPDQAIGDIGSIITNLAQLTSTLSSVRGPLKQALLDAPQTTPDVSKAVAGAVPLFDGAVALITPVSDLETDLGAETQQTLDAISVAVRKATAHAPFLAKLLSPMPAVINYVAPRVNNHGFSIRYRPPTYRVRTPDRLLQCGIMNAKLPGSCADVAGMPYSIDVQLLQYVLAQANR